MTEQCGFDCPNEADSVLPDGRPVCERCGAEVVRAFYKGRS